MSISVVVIGRNEGPRLERCLQSVKEINWPEPVELIYVDSGSTDGSLALARSLGAETLTVSPVRPTAALGRNAGWRKASGDLILFLDGDTILHPQFAIDSVHEFQNDRTAVVWGHRREIHPEASVFNRVLDLDWMTRPGITAFCGGDSIMRRNALAEVNGFDEGLIAGEEPELCARLRARGWQIVHVDRAMTGHDLAIINFVQYWRRATRTGYAYAEISERLKNSVTPLWSREAASNRHRALTFIILWFIVVQSSVATRNIWPSAALLGAFAALVARSAWKMRWKSSNLTTCLLYGVHSHLQQIPIYIGQLQYRTDRSAGRKRGLIEYRPVP